jgi:hypothetical protein
MEIDEIFKIAAAVIGSLGGGALIVAAFANWLGGIWAKKMLQNERAKHAEDLENIKAELEVLKTKDVTRHHDKLSTYREVIGIVSVMLSELEEVSSGKKETISTEAEKYFSVNRSKIYGYISLVSNQEVMDGYNELFDYLIQIIYSGEKGEWSEMRDKADVMLNAMRQDLGINEGNISYRGEF